MRTLLFLLTIFILFGSCGVKNDSKNDNLESNSTKNVLSDSIQPQTEKKEVFLTVEAQFIEFSLGDASHFIFTDESGKMWDFAGSNSKNFKFERILDVAEINDENQGWGSTTKLQGKWFKIDYSLEDREQYIDGPIGTVQIIQESELIENTFSGDKTNTDFGLESSTIKEPVKGFVYVGNKSPDGSVALQIEQIDPTSSEVTIKSTNLNKTIKGIYLSPIEKYWSENSNYVVLNNVDTYAGSGTYSIVLLNVKSAAYVSIDINQLFEGIEFGDREMLNLKNITWLNDQSFFIEAYLSYVGYSGHPGIDYSRKKLLGDKFADPDDIIILPSRKYTIN